MMRPDFLETAKAALDHYYPGYNCAFVGGSMLRGEDTPTSDIDIVVFFDDDFAHPHRYSVIEQGWPIEFFIQNCYSHDYFMSKDREQGLCIIMNMVADGIIVPQETELALERRAKARELRKAGPPQLDKDDLDARRYALSDALEDLYAQRPYIDQLGVLASLYTGLGDLYLRGQGKWSAVGKALGRYIREDNPDVAARFENAFLHAQRGEFDALKQLAHTVISPYGGCLFEGYKQMASNGWKELK